MASSGNFNTSGYSFGENGVRYLTFKWEIESQSIENNTTTIKWELVGAGSYKYNPVVSDIHVVIDGDVVFDKPNTYHVNVWPDDVVASGKKTLTHKDDGTRSFSVYVEAGIYVWAANCSGSGTFTLDTIARASQPSCITWPEHTQDVGYFGDEISIHMNRKSDKFTHTVRYAYGNLSGTIAQNVTTGTTWIIPLSFMNLIPNATSGSGTIYVDTYNGSTKIGTKYCGFTAKVPASVKPKCSIQVLDNTSTKDKYGNLVKGLSKLYVKTNATIAYSSPINAYNVNANGVKYYEAEIVTGVISKAGTTTITATVTDKRGRTSDQASASFPVLDYSPPVIPFLSVHRCNADGSENEQGEFVEVVFSGEVTPLNNRNSAVYSVRYKKTSDDSWTNLTADVNGWKPADLTNNYSVYNFALIFVADGNSSYDVEVSLKDDINTTTKATSVSTAFTLFNCKPTGNGIAFGKVSEKDYTMEINMDVEFLGKVSGKIFDAIYPVGSIYLAYNHTNPGTLFPGTTWARIEGAFPWFSGETGTIGQTGGEREVTLTAKQIPSHNHGGTYTNAGSSRTHAWLASGGSAMGFDSVNAGGGEAHNNMPPYIQISAWRRTA